jgi:phosphoglycerol transferase MdoB-like AlkP superfamily enzyme
LVTYLFRFFKVLPLEKKDTTGMTERMVLFIFLVNQMYLYAIITVIVGITYKYIFEKFRNKEIFFSPIIGFIFSLLWLLLLNNI